MAYAPVLAWNAAPLSSFQTVTGFFFVSTQTTGQGHVWMAGFNLDPSRVLWIACPVPKNSTLASHCLTNCLMARRVPLGET